MARRRCFAGLALRASRDAENRAWVEGCSHRDPTRFLPDSEKNLHEAGLRRAAYVRIREERTSDAARANYGVGSPLPLFE
jgi:hypothetical protein